MESVNYKELFKEKLEIIDVIISNLKESNKNLIISDIDGDSSEETAYKNNIDKAIMLLEISKEEIIKAINI